MHSWGDNWPYWGDLYKAEEYICTYVKKWSRCRVDMKEKWGTLRYNFVYPPCQGCGPVISAPWKKKYPWSKEPIRPILFMWSSSWLYYKWMKFGTWCLVKAVKKACKRWPQCATEIKDGLEFLLDRKI